MTSDELVLLLEQLTGEPVPFTDRLKDVHVLFGPEPQGLGYSQLNELLLVAGLDRITRAFFAYLLTGTPQYEAGMAFNSAGDLESGVARFRKTALLNYGNVKFAFKSLSRNEPLLLSDLASLESIGTESFEERHAPLLPLEQISPDEAYLTGYLIEGELRSRLKAIPSDSEAQSLEKKRQAVVAIAVRNQTAYLASDHLDVYVATSMRARHEFISIGRTVREIFGHQDLKELKLRWFDPTQAYCLNRIDKGLSEALMLRRAACTIYLAQESDTLGKDSELASTLAQGKPVIAYVPHVDAEYLKQHLAVLREADATTPEPQLLLDQLRLFEPSAAWNDPEVRRWCADPAQAPMSELKARLYERIKDHYDKRAGMLRETHPLGIQVNLGTGVANGVLVVRRIADCAALVRAILTRSLDVVLTDDKDCTVLREKISNSIFRVMTRDTMLTNTFWNFYLNPAE